MAFGRAPARPVVPPLRRQLSDGLLLRYNAMQVGVFRLLDTPGHGCKACPPINRCKRRSGGPSALGKPNVLEPSMGMEAPGKAGRCRRGRQGIEARTVPFPGHAKAWAQPRAEPFERRCAEMKLAGGDEARLRQGPRGRPSNVRAGRRPRSTALRCALLGRRPGTGEGQNMNDRRGFFRQPPVV